MLDDLEQVIDLSNGIIPKKGWSLKMIDSETLDKVGFNIHSLYDYETLNNVCKRKLVKQGVVINPDDVDLDVFMWETVVDYVEESRLFVFNTCKEEGVNDCESYFLSLKFIYSALKKFRNRLYREFNNRIDYDKAPLKIATNHLLHVRLDKILVSNRYKFSKEAANGQLGSYRKEAAWAAAQHLAEETGVIFHAKVTL